MNTDLEQVKIKYAASGYSGAYLTELHSSDPDLYAAAAALGIVPKWNTKTSSGRGANNGNLQTLDLQVGNLNMEALSRVKDQQDEEVEDLEIEEKKGSSLLYEQNGSLRKPIKRAIIIGAVVLVALGIFIYIKKRH